jgi:NAD(P)H-dependent FMN reductase
MADPVKVVCICGSLRKKSFNAALARQAQTGRDARGDGDRARGASQLRAPWL